MAGAGWVLALFEPAACGSEGRWTLKREAVGLKPVQSVTDTHADDKLTEIRARHAAATPGPHRWRGNASSYAVHLSTAWGGGYYVLGFQKWGMRYAQPTFLGTRVSRAERSESPFAWTPDAADTDYDRRVQSNMEAFPRKTRKPAPELPYPTLSDDPDTRAYQERVNRMLEHEQTTHQRLTGPDGYHPYVRSRPLNGYRERETGRSVITPANLYFKYEVGYRHDITGIAHPDAIAIEKSWEDREWLIGEVERLRKRVAELEEV